MLSKATFFHGSSLLVFHRRVNLLLSLCFAIFWIYLYRFFMYFRVFLFILQVAAPTAREQEMQNVCTSGFKIISTYLWWFRWGVQWFGCGWLAAWWARCWCPFRSLVVAWVDSQQAPAAASLPQSSLPNHFAGHVSKRSALVYFIV